MTTKKIKLISVGGVSEGTKAKIKEIFATAKNPNQILLNVIPEYAFAQGDVLYFTGLRTNNPTIEEMEVAVLE